MSNAYKEGRGLWSEEVAYWLDRLFQNEPSKEVVKDLKKTLIDTKSPEELVHTLKTTVNNYFGKGDFPSIDGSSLQKVYQDDQWLLLEAWSASDIESLVGKKWHLSKAGFFNSHTFQDFARSYVLYRKKPEGDMEIIGFHMWEDRRGAHIKCAFDFENEHCFERLEQVLESSPNALRDSLRGFSEEDIYQKPALFLANLNMERSHTMVSKGVYQKLLSEWFEESNPKWGKWEKMGDKSRYAVDKNLMFLVKKYSDAEAFLSLQMGRGGSVSNSRRWTDTLAYWCLSDKPPVVSAEVIKRFMAEAGNSLLSDSALMDLLMLSSRLAPDVTVMDLLTQVKNSRNSSLSSILGQSSFSHRKLWMEGDGDEDNLSRPDWLKSALNKMLECAPGFGYSYLDDVLQTERRWFGSGLYDDSQWNNRLLDVFNDIKESNQAQGVDLLSAGVINKYQPIFSRVMAFPEGVRWLRECCQSSPTIDWVLEFSRTFDEKSIIALLSDLVLAPESLAQLKASIPSWIAKQAQVSDDVYSFRDQRLDVMLWVLFDQASSTLSTHQESLLAALCGNDGEYQPMRLALGVVVRDQGVRLDEGEGWEGRFASMKGDLQILKELLRGNRLSLDLSDNHSVSPDDLIGALKKCGRYDLEMSKKGMCYDVVYATDILDACVDSFSVSELQSLVDAIEDREKTLNVLPRNVMQCFRIKIRQKERASSREYSPSAGF